MSAPAHPLFEKAPLRGDITISTGAAPVPYHVYDGHGLLVLGFCDGAALEAAFDGQDVHPVRTRSGKGVLILFICDFYKASHGPHNEFHITAMAAPEPGATLPDDPAAALTALATQPDWGVLSLHLWNDSPSVVAYNSEYLGLQAMQAAGEITRTQGHLSFAFKNQQGTLLVAGKVRLNTQSDAGLMLRILRHLGLRGIWRAARDKVSQAAVINRKSGPMPHNGRAQTYTAPDNVVVTAYDAAHDQLETTSGPLHALGFSPQILQHLWPFRFIYLHPDDS